VSGILLQPGWRVLEHRRIVTPLGIRFWDPALDVAVDDGLTVTAFPEGSRRQSRTAFRTAGGVYAFRNLPGLHDYENPIDDSDAPGSLPIQRRFLIEVNDREGRFQPACFFVDAPVRGIFPSQVVTSLGAAPPGFYLFSASTRAATPVLGTVRAELRERLDATGDRPASYALLEIAAPSASYLGMADARGVVSVILPYPVFTAAPGGPSSLIPSFIGTEQSWAISVRVAYQPSALSVPPEASLPELRTVLSQAPGVIWTRRTVPPGMGVSSFDATLVFGQEMVLRSEQESVLLIGPGSMP
jgi:hypothetical protein